MPPLKVLRARSGTVAELLRVLWERKRWWLVPMVLLLLLFGAFLLLAQGSAVAPFIYTLF